MIKNDYFLFNGISSEMTDLFKDYWQDSSEL